MTNIHNDSHLSASNACAVYADSAVTAAQVAAKVDPSHFAKTKSHEEKHSHGEAVYALLRQAAIAQGGVLPKELKGCFYRLCHLFAASVLYSQKTADKQGNVSAAEGFRRCAQLTEISLAMQLSDHGLVSPIAIDWEAAPTLRALLDDPHEESAEIVKKAILSLDPAVQITHFSDEEREQFYMTVFRLSWAQQNLTELKTGEMIPTHDAFTKWSATFCGADEERLLVYLYNRVCIQGFGISPSQRLEKLLQAYDDVLEQGARRCSTAGVPYRQINCQVLNMKALLLVNAGRPYTDWLPLSKEALQGYNQLIAEVSSQARTQETADKIVTLRTLRGNCLAALVDGLVAKQSQEKDNPYEVDRLRTALKEAADMLQDSIEEFRQLGINNGFFDSYNAALSKVRAALQ